VVELHVAGTSWRDRDGYAYVDDDHTPAVLPTTWEIFERVAPAAPNLRAVVFECERNDNDAVAPAFARIEAAWTKGASRALPARTRESQRASSTTAADARRLARWAVCMHYDRAFAVDVVGGRVDAAALGVAPAAAQLLRDVDARAFQADDERAARTLAALLDEAPVSAAVVGRAGLLGFFASALFRSAVVEGRLLVEAFCDWLESCAGPTARLERAVALARRQRAQACPPGSVVRCAGVDVVALPAGTFAHWAAARASLGGDAAQLAAAVAHGARVAPVVVDGSEPEHVLIDAAGGVAPCAEGLASLLRAAGAPTGRAALTETAAALGAGDEAAVVIDELIAEGLLAAP
jgi:hypothetical protein